MRCSLTNKLLRLVDFFTFKYKISPTKFLRSFFIHFIGVSIFSSHLQLALLSFSFLSSFTFRTTPSRAVLSKSARNSRSAFVFLPPADGRQAATLRLKFYSAVNSSADCCHWRQLHRQGKTKVRTFSWMDRRNRDRSRGSSSFPSTRESNQVNGFAKFPLLKVPWHFRWYHRGAANLLPKIYESNLTNEGLLVTNMLLIFLDWLWLSNTFYKLMPDTVVRSLRYFSFFHTECICHKYSRKHQDYSAVSIFTN